LLDLMYQGIDKVLISSDQSIEIIWKYNNIFIPTSPNPSSAG